MSIKRAVALGLCLLLIALLSYQVYGVDDAMQYLTLSPAEPEQDPEKPAPTQLSALIKKLEGIAEDWPGILSAWALTSQNESVQLEGKNGQSAAARLVGVYGNQSALPTRLARFGRDLYAEDLQNGEPVILLSEPLAIALFRAGDPVDRVVMLNETEYRVVGILRDQRDPGEHDEYVAYVPLLSLENAAYQTRTLTVSARGVKGAGSAARFKSDMAAWQADGDLYLLAKERSRAMLPVRALLVVLGFCAVLFLYRQYKKMALSLLRDYQARLRSLFAAQLMPRMFAYLLLALLAGGALLAALYFLVQFMLEPVYIFPEWIPAVPVEWRDISSTFWQNQVSVTKAVELRSPELLTLRFYRVALTALCTLFGLIFCKGYGRRREKLTK